MTTRTSPTAHGHRRALCHALDVALATCDRARDQTVRAKVTPERPAPLQQGVRVLNRLLTRPDISS